MPQNTSEATYTGYARISGVRSAAGWTVAAGVASNAAIIQFGENTGIAAQTVTHYGIGFAEVGAGRLLFADAFAAGKEVRIGDEPKYAIGALTVTLSGDAPAALLTDLMELIFQNVTCENIGDAAGLLASAGAGNMWVSLHTGNPNA